MAEAEALWNQARDLLAVARATDKERIALESRLKEARARFPRRGSAGAGQAQSACC
jgi:hypothetical protein